MTDIEDLLPLTPAVFHILLVLAKGEKHGYEIMKQVQLDSSGGVRMGNGTLYGSIKRMLADDLIADAGEKPGDDARRKYYKLTTRGRKVLNAEMKRYVETAALIKSRKLAPTLSLDGARA
jgi:DNA-binding PadR family transcriptional regulator